jgi:RNase P subunit RPR2
MDCTDCHTDLVPTHLGKKTTANKEKRFFTCHGCDPEEPREKQTGNVRLDRAF